MSNVLFLTLLCGVRRADLGAGPGDDRPGDGGAAQLRVRPRAWAAAGQVHGDCHHSQRGEATYVCAGTLLHTFGIRRCHCV
jgi:hypothetical protein